LSSKVGIVVPTLGKRPDYLVQCLESIRLAGHAHVCLVAAADFEHQALIDSGLVHSFVVDPATGLSDAINKGIASLPEEISYVNWLGDDDLLSSGSLLSTEAVLEANPDTVLVYGACDYVDPNGELIFTNRSGGWASWLMSFGPNLVPQPGSLFRRTAFEKTGELSKNYDWAFDFDLLLNLRKLGRLRYLNKTLASFRWHPGSLTVEHRRHSVAEASRVRISHLPKFIRPISILWEYPVRQATYLAGLRVSNKAKRLAK
jgi:GT2 family glycosyltransferase